MPTARGTTWTEKEETFKIQEGIWEGHYYKILGELRATDAKDAQSRATKSAHRFIGLPKCALSFKTVCEGYAPFIVYDSKKKMKKEAFFIGMVSGAALYPFGGKYYIPTNECSSCGAYKDGYRAGLSHAGNLKEVHDIMDRSTATPEEIARNKRIAGEGYKRGTDKKNEKEQNTGLQRYGVKRK